MNQIITPGAKFRFKSFNPSKRQMEQSSLFEITYHISVADIWMISGKISVGDGWMLSEYLWVISKNYLGVTFGCLGQNGGLWCTFLTV